MLKSISRRLVATGLGLVALGAGAAGAFAQSSSRAFTPFLNASDLRSLEADGDGNLWIASNGGVLRFDTSRGTWTAFPRRTVGGPVSNDLTAVAVDDLGRIWFGSADRGISILDPAVERWDTFIEWPDPRISVIRSFGTGVFIGTEAGLALRFEPQRTDICNEIDVGCIVPSFEVNDYAMIGDTLWVATAAGLGRFNGTTWDSVGALPAGSLDGAVAALAVSEGTVWNITGREVRRLEGDAWIATGIEASGLAVTGGTLLALDRGKVSEWLDGRWQDLQVPIPADLDVRDGVLMGTRLDLATDRGLWTWSEGALQAVQSTPPGPAIPDFHRGLAVAGDGTVWVGNQEGLMSYDGSAWTLFPKGKDGLDKEWIFSLASVQDEVAIGHCCCDAPPRCRLDFRTSAAFSETGVTDIWSMAVDARGRIWAATNDEGVRVLERDGGGTWRVVLEITNATTSGALRSNSIRAVAVTSRGTYFGHTQSLGVDFWPHGEDIESGFNPDAWSAVTVSSGLLDGSVSSLRAVGTDVYVGTSTGLHRLAVDALLSRYPTNFIEQPGDLPRIVQTIVADRQGGIWAGTNDGLLYLEPRGSALRLFDTGNSDLPHDNILSGDLDPTDGSVWFGTAEGIVRVDPALVQGGESVPDAFVVYPNPFRADRHNRVTLALSVSGAQPRSAADEIAEAEVLDITGRLVGHFVLRRPEWQWDLRNLNGDPVSSGIYLVRARTAAGDPVDLKLGVIR